MEQMQRQPTGEFVGLGVQQELNAQRQAAAQRLANAEYEYAVKAGVHQWAVIMSHRATDTLLDAFDGNDPDNLPILDTETLLDPPGICCMVCEQHYEPRLRRRKCPGEPK